MLADYLKLEVTTKLDFFMNSLSATNRTPSYYVNWQKVNSNTKEFELELTTLSYLIGKDNIEEEARGLFIKQPDLLRAIPTLIASREKQFDVLRLDEFYNMEFYNINFKKIDITAIDTYLLFISETGLFDFIRDSVKRSLVDYVYGVEAGMDSNARKNRSGTIMEEIVEKSVSKTCQELNFEMKTQATSKWMEENWGVHVPVDKSARRFDVAVYDEIRKKVYVIETNYYGGGGSKLKSVCGEFTTLNNLINTSSDDVSFVWVTDGIGWRTTKIPLSEAFKQIEHVLNLNMLKDGFMKDVLTT